MAALAAGVHGYLPKTLSLAQINNALRVVLNGQIFVPAELADLAAEDSPVVPLEQPEGKVRLPSRQREVLQLMAKGKSNKEIAQMLHLAEGTIKLHVSALYRHLNVHNRAGAVAALSTIERLIGA